jgi:hypothetical protein
MDTYLEEIEAIIVAGTTHAGAGSDFPIFLGHLPDSTVASVTDRAVGVIPTVGGPSMARVEIDEPGLQVVVRGASVYETSTAFEEAWGVAVEVRDSLHEFTGEPSSDGKLVVGIWNQSGPFLVGFDHSMRPVFSNNFRVMRSRTT